MDISFRTIVNTDKLPFGIDYKTHTLFLGSCFAENIGNLLLERKFPVSINPFGVVYNPTSVATALKRIINGNPFSGDDLNYYNKLWFSFHHHTSFSSPDKEECLGLINSTLEQAHSFWQTANCLIITFGTARIYRYRETGQAVGNCHKIPAKEFVHQLLSIDEIVMLWSQMLREQIAIKPNLKIILTVSPIRHWKDGAIGNQISKSTLILAANKLTEEFPNNVFYFPSYEIMMDDLRDYRFYSDDMLHPSTVAINYIWEQFSRTVVTSSAQTVASDVEKIIKTLNHKPFKTNTKQYLTLVESTLKKIDEICKKYSFLNFDEEIKNLRAIIDAGKK